jgi:hypothetical protein
MSNASTVRRQIAGTQQLTIAPLLGTVITTTPTAFQLNNNGLTLTGGGVIPLSAGVTGLYAGTGEVLRYRATGTYTGATAASTTLKLQAYEIPAALLPIANTLVAAQTFTNWNPIVPASNATAVGQATGSFAVDLRVQLDAFGNLSGSIKFLIDGTVIVPETAITVVTGLVGEADLNFVIVATLGTATTGVILTLDEFGLDLE